MVILLTQVAKWGNSQGIRIEKRAMRALGLQIGDMVEIFRKGEEIIMKPIHGIDWYMQDYEKPDGRQEHNGPEWWDEW